MTMAMSIKTKRIIGNTFSHIIIILFGIVMLYPVAWLIMSSLKAGNTIFSDPSLIPKSITFQHYITGWSGVGRIRFAVFFKNSLAICLSVVVLNMISCSMAGYAFARLNFKFKNILFAAMMVTLMLPAHVTTIPRYINFKNLGMIDHPLYLALILPKLFATDAFFVFLLVQFMRGLPKDLDESARLDGCGRIGIYLRIVLPLTAPALITTALFTFLWTWDDFMNQLLYINTPAKYTVPLGLRMFLDATGTSNWGAMLAMSVLSIVPCFILFFSLQKYFVQGIATTGIKG
ncbi:sugar ABC transporter permease [Clostridia bacterium]|nr:sugar ABC transporter permease [Clostridia bacterium]